VTEKRAPAILTDMSSTRSRQIAPDDRGSGCSYLMSLGTARYYRGFCSHRAEIGTIR
jgi:hypothetical protein